MMNMDHVARRVCESVAALRRSPLCKYIEHAHTHSHTQEAELEAAKAAELEANGPKRDCSACGHPLKKEENFCGKCGKKSLHQSHIYTCIYMYMYIYMYIYIYIHLYTYVYIYIVCVGICIYIVVCICICMHLYTYTCT